MRFLVEQLLTVGWFVIGAYHRILNRTPNHNLNPKTQNSLLLPSLHWHFETGGTHRRAKEIKIRSTIMIKIKNAIALPNAYGFGEFGYGKTKRPANKCHRASIVSGWTIMPIGFVTLETEA